MYDGYKSETQTICFMNPGYPGSFHPGNVSLSSTNRINDVSDIVVQLPGEINTKNIDHVVSKKLFGFYLDAGCVRGTEEYEYLLMMTGDESTPWPKPIPVFGYNEAQHHLFEANTVIILVLTTSF
jgi:hypothetical protein